MRNGIAVLVIATSSVVLIGCAARPLYYEQDHFRGYLLQLYDNQVMDNLIRARNQLPIVHLDYGKMTGTVTVDATGALGGEHLNASSALTDKFTYAFGGAIKNQLTVTAEPVLDDHALYGWYLAYLADDGGGGLQKNDVPSDPSAVHRQRQFEGDIYWVPANFAEKYFALAMRTTLLRKEPVSAPTVFELNATAMGEAECLEDAALVDCKQWIFKLSFDKPLRNDSGVILNAVIEGSVRPLRLRSNPEVAAHAPTQELFVVYDQETIAFAPTAVMKAVTTTDPLRVRLDHHSASEAMKLEKSLSDLAHEAQLFRLEAAGNR